MVRQTYPGFKRRHSKEDIQSWLDEVWQYIQEVGDLKGIAELAELDVIDGDKPKSTNSIYMAAYKAATAYHSINVEVINE